MQTMPLRKQFFMSSMVDQKQRDCLTAAMSWLQQHRNRAIDCELALWAPLGPNGKDRRIVLRPGTDPATVEVLDGRRRYVGVVPR